jgi:hypothetical protein
MIIGLKDEQINKLIDYGKKWTDIGLSTAPVDIFKAMDSIKLAYKYAGLDSPKVFLGPFNNPVECAKAQIVVKKLPNNTEWEKLQVLDIMEGTEFSPQEIEEAIAEQMHGYHDSEWLCSYDFIKDINDELFELDTLKGLMAVAENVGWWAAYDKVAFIQDRPEEIHFDENGELHNADGPAIKWRGEDRGYDIYCIHGELQPPPA